MLVQLIYSHVSMMRIDNMSNEIFKLLHTRVLHERMLLSPGAAASKYLNCIMCTYVVIRLEGFATLVQLPEARHACLSR
jgi:hypothetical protein